VFQKLKKDKSGVGWVLGVAVLSILLMPFVYFPLSYAWDQVCLFITDSYVFTGVYANALNVVKFLISYLLVFGFLFTINWAIVNSKARRYQA
jgi:hypothetical protein